VGEESAELAPAEAVVGRLGVGVVRDHAVVSVLLRFVRCNDWATVLHTLCHVRHACILLALEVCHPLGS